MRAFWEDEVYIITKQLDEDSPVYEIKPEEMKGKSKVLHRTLLLLCDHLPMPESTVSLKNSKNEKKCKVQHKGKHHRNSLCNELPEYKDDPDSDNNEIPSFLAVNHLVQPALTVDVPANQPQILTPPPTPVPSSPVHQHADYTDHVETPLTPLLMNASPIDDTTPNVVAPYPSDPEHSKKCPHIHSDSDYPQLCLPMIPFRILRFDLQLCHIFRPAQFMVNCHHLFRPGQLPLFIPYVPPAPPFISSPPSLQPYPMPHYYSLIPIPAPRYYPPTPFVPVY